MRRLFAAALALGFATAGAAQADDTLSPLHFQSQGVFGSYDKAALQRGFLVYETNCAACHALNALHYRDLEGLGLTPDEVAGIAASVKLADGSPATLDSRFKDPHAKAASFGGAEPPDLSNIVNARPGGLGYIYRYLTGYVPAPDGVTLLPGRNYNLAFPGNQTAMPAPLKGNDVTYADGTAATLPQEAQDVTAFLAWTADPNLDARREIGIRAVMFLVFLSIIAIANKRKTWRETV
jgi:ubiquinol-cytochrome c reductase cytochrome c1 subunit